MAMSERAAALKAELMPLIELRYKLERQRRCMDVLRMGNGRYAGEALAEITREKRETNRAFGCGQRRLPEILRCSALSEVQRTVLCVRYEDGLSWSQVAEVMGFGRRYVIKLHNQALEAVAGGRAA